MATTITLTIPLDGVRAKTYAQAVDAAYFELQAHAEVCEDEEHQGEVDDALSLLNELTVALNTATEARA